MKKLLPALIIFTMIISSSTGISAETTDPFDYARTVYEYIDENYYGEIDEDVLAQNLVKAIAESLDRYSVFMTPQEAAKFLDDISGEFVGIGITLLNTDQALKVVSVMKSSPARKSGLLAGDQIYYVDDIYVRFTPAQEAAALIRGPEGGSVTLKIKREGIEELMIFTVIRERITVDPVSYRIIGDVGYLEITSFNNNTYSRTLEALPYFRKRGISKLVLDLRDNGGGLVSQAVLVAGELVREGTVTSLDFENPEYPDLTYVSKLAETEFDLAVLVNENTASAAELLAAAVMETDSGMLLGTKTFGKGIFQTGQYIASYDKYREVLEVTGISLDAEETGGYLHFTSGRYLTPLGNDIHGIGLEPNIVIEDTEGYRAVKAIDRLSGYFDHDPGEEFVISRNAASILGLLGYPEDDIGGFQQDSGLEVTQELNYITKRMLDYRLGELLVTYDAQLTEALKRLDAEGY
jgi:carboxyl-terminal processing protease